MYSRISKLPFEAEVSSYAGRIILGHVPWALNGHVSCHLKSRVSWLMVNVHVTYTRVIDIITNRQPQKFAINSEESYWRKNHWKRAHILGLPVGSQGCSFQSTTARNWTSLCRPNVSIFRDFTRLSKPPSIVSQHLDSIRYIDIFPLANTDVENPSFVDHFPRETLTHSFLCLPRNLGFILSGRENVYRSSMYRWKSILGESQHFVTFFNCLASEVLTQLQMG